MTRALVLGGGGDADEVRELASILAKTARSMIARIGAPRP
jgi:hypothetical protein